MLSTWTSLVSPPDFHSVPLHQNEAATAKEFIKIMEAAENDYQVCVCVCGIRNGHIHVTA